MCGALPPGSNPFVRVPEIVEWINEDASDAAAVRV
jgi:hypothetical protein